MTIVLICSVYRMAPRCGKPVPNFWMRILFRRQYHPSVCYLSRLMISSCHTLTRIQRWPDMCSNKYSNRIQISKFSLIMMNWKQVWRMVWQWYRQVSHMHFSRQSNCWSLRCSWNIACRRCSNYIFILHLTLGFNIQCIVQRQLQAKTRNIWDLVHIILEITQYLSVNQKVSFIWLIASKILFYVNSASVNLSMQPLPLLKRCGGEFTGALIT